MISRDSHNKKGSSNIKPPAPVPVAFTGTGAFMFHLLKRMIHGG
jgi:hypothetical protein